MPKKIIYNNFIGGLSTSDRQGPDGSYFIGREVDPYRNQGYISPGLSATNLSGIALVTNQIIDISDVQYTGGQSGCFAIDDGGNSGGTSARVYALDTETDTVSNVTAPTFPHDIASSVGKGITLYEAKAASATGVRLFYILGGTIGRFDFEGNFDDDYMSTIPAGASSPAFKSATPGNEFHPHLKWNSLLYVGDGRFLAKYDGAVGDGGEGTWTPQDLDLGSNWHITALFSTRDYIGICVTERKNLATNPTEDKFRTRSKVFFWDGNSTTSNYWLDIGDNLIKAAINNNGLIELFTSGRQPAGTIKILGDVGAETIRFTKHDIDGTITDFDAPLFGGVDIFKGRTIFGASDQNVIMSYGREEIGQPMGLTFPWADYSVSASQIGALRTVNEDKVFFSSKKATNYSIQVLSTGNSGNAQYKGLYTDFGQKVRVNYVKFYFKTLVSGDAITPTLDLDYGTNVTLTDLLGNTNISFANDGTATSKRFNVQRDCHSIRPVIDWTTGGVAISKIVIDYDIKPQDN